MTTDMSDVSQMPQISPAAMCASAATSPGHGTNPPAPHPLLLSFRQCWHAFLNGCCPAANLEEQELMCGASPSLPAWMSLFWPARMSAMTQQRWGNDINDSTYLSRCNRVNLVMASKPRGAGSVGPGSTSMMASLPV